MIEALVRRDSAEAARLHFELLPLVDALFWQPNPMPLKAAFNELDFYVGKPRLPLVELTEAEKERLRTVLRSVGEFDPYLAKQPVAA